MEFILLTLGWVACGGLTIAILTKLFGPCPDHEKLRIYTLLLFIGPLSLLLVPYLYLTSLGDE